MGASRLRANTEEPHSGQNFLHKISRSLEIIPSRYSLDALFLSWQTRKRAILFLRQL